MFPPLADTQCSHKEEKELARVHPRGERCDLFGCPFSSYQLFAVLVVLSVFIKGANEVFSALPFQTTRSL